MVYAWEQEIIQGSTKASAVYTFDIAEALHISGTPTVTVKAAADESTGILSAMLVDIAPEGMNAVVLGAYSEGVETEGELTALQKLKPDLLQGYLLIS